MARRTGLGVVELVVDFGIMSSVTDAIGSSV